MLKMICYITKEDFSVSDEWKAKMHKKEIQFLKASLNEIDENWDYDSTIFLCEYAKDARLLYDLGYFVVISCSDKNKDESFDRRYAFAVEYFDEIEPDYYIKMWQRFRKIPWHIVNTKRCRIREMTPDDLDALYEIYQDASITKYMEGLYDEREKELEYIKKYIENVYSYFGFGTWIIERKEDGKVIGRAGFNYRPDFEDPELGFVIAKAYQKQGYACEVCKEIIAYAWEELGFSSIQALTDPDNTASIQLLDKLVFVKKDLCVIESKKYYCFKKKKKDIEEVSSIKD